MGALVLRPAVRVARMGNMAWTLTANTSGCRRQREAVLDQAQRLVWIGAEAVSMKCESDFVVELRSGSTRLAHFCMCTEHLVLLLELRSGSLWHVQWCSSHVSCVYVHATGHDMT